MKSRLTAMLIGLSSLAIATSAAAHEPHYRSSGGLSGSITISTGAPYPGGFYGTLHYGHAYPIVPAYYPQGVYYRNCGHWHAPRYQGYNRVAYRGYDDGHWKHHGKRHGKGHKGHRDYNRGYDYHR